MSSSQDVVQRDTAAAQSAAPPVALLHRLWHRTLRRFGGAAIAAAVCLLLALGLREGSVRLALRSAALEAATEQGLDRLHRQGARAAPRPPSTAEQIARFSAAFPALSQASADLELVFRHAVAHGLTLDKGEYQLRPDTESTLDVYTATFPVHASYAAIKDFSADVLRELPHASLEELRIARDNTDSASLDALVRFSFTYRSIR